MPTVTLLSPKRLMIHGVLFHQNRPQETTNEIARALDNRSTVRVDWHGVKPGMPRSTGARQAAVEPDRDPAETARRLTQIRAAVAKLDPDNESHFTQLGKPDARALSVILGWPVSGAERDAALASAHPAESPPELDPPDLEAGEPDVEPDADPDPDPEPEPAVEPAPLAAKSGTIKLTRKTPAPAPDPTTVGAVGV